MLTTINALYPADDRVSTTLRRRAESTYQSLA
jgi:hypothetical protein